MSWRHLIFANIIEFSCLKETIAFSMSLPKGKASNRYVELWFSLDLSPNKLLKTHSSGGRWSLSLWRSSALNNDLARFPGLSVTRIMYLNLDFLLWHRHLLRINPSRVFNLRKHFNCIYSPNWTPDIIYADADFNYMRSVCRCKSFNERLSTIA